MCYTVGMNAKKHCDTVEANVSNCAPSALYNASLTSEETTILADLLKVVADTTRLRILDLIASQPDAICVCDISSQFNQHPPTISHHLRVLRTAGLVDVEKQGLWVHYRATSQGKALLQTIRALV